MADTYAVYPLHVGILVVLQGTLAGADLPPLVKFGLVPLFGVPLCFVFVEGLRRVSGFRGLG